MVTVDLDELAEAMDRSDDEPFDRRLDVQTGEIELIPNSSGWGETLSPELEKALEEEPDRFLSVPRVEGREQFLWMGEFADAIEEDDIRDRLANALEGRGAFGRFRAVLSGYPDLRERWFAVREARLAAAAEEWLRSLDVQFELVRRPKVEQKAPPPSRQAKKLPLKFSHVLLLGAAEPASAPGRVRRVVRAPGQGRALFKQVVRDLCDSRGVGWRNRFIEGTSRFELEDVTVRHDDHGIDVEMTVPAEIAALFDSASRSR